MAAPSSWSLRGVDPRAREIARTSAKREGITIGEWLNRQLLEDGELLPGAVPVNDPEALAQILNRLSRRIAAAEQRSALAITGIDESVLAAVSRVDDPGAEHSQLSERYAAAIGELRETQSALHTRIERLEREGRAPGELAMLRSLEEALAKVADQVYASEAETNAKLEALKADMDREAGQAAERLDVVTRTLDTRITEVERKADAQYAEVAESARALEAHSAAASDDVARLEMAVAGVSERLAAAERTTDAAIRSLENTFAALDARMRRSETSLEGRSDERERDAFAAAVESRFERLSRELADVVATTRAEIAGKVAEVADRQGATGPIDDQIRAIAEQVAASEGKQRRALARISLKVAKLAEAVETHLRDAESARSQIEDAQSQAAHVAELAEIQVRLNQAEETSAAALDAVSRRVEALDDWLAERDCVSHSDLDRRLRDSEDRTRALIDGAIGGTEAAPAASPVQRALDALRARLDVLEGAGPRLFGDASLATSADLAAFEESDLVEMSPPTQSSGLPALTATDESGDELTESDGHGPFALVYGRSVEERRLFVGVDNRAILPILDEPREHLPRFDVARAAREAARMAREVAEAAWMARDAIRKGRGLLLAAGGLAFIAVGAAGVIALRDPNSSSDRRDRDADPREDLFTAPTAAAPARTSEAVGAVATPGFERSVPADIGGADLSRYAQGRDLSETRAAAPQNPARVAILASVTPDIAAMAEAGDPIAMHTLARIRFHEGDAQEGMRLILAAAEAGVAPAQYGLAKLYQNGHVTNVDMAEAVRWTEAAAAAGHRDAMHDMGMFYATGWGVEQDYEAAARWFHQAAELGAPASQYNLAVLYERGLGLKRSIPYAYAWFTVASASGDRAAAAQAMHLASTRMKPRERERADETARLFVPRPLNEAANGVYRQTPWDAQGDGQPDVDVIAVAQASLMQLGRASGDPSGVAARTISERRSDVAGAPPGLLDAALLEKLEAGAASL